MMATGNHHVYVKHAVDSINRFLMPEIRKDVLILSDSLVPMVQALGWNCVIHTRRCPSFNKSSHIFELMLQNLDLISQADFCYKLDADISVHQYISSEDILPLASQDFSIVRNFGWSREYMMSIQPKTFSAVIPSKFQHGPYWIACLFGGRTENIVVMAEELDKMIKRDRENKTMWGAWEEPYVNYYFAIREPQVRTLSPAYASPLYWHIFPDEARAAYQKMTDNMPVKIFHFNHTPDNYGHHVIG